MESYPDDAPFPGDAPELLFDNLGLGADVVPPGFASEVGQVTGTGNHDILEDVGPSANFEENKPYCSTAELFQLHPDDHLLSGFEQLNVTHQAAHVGNFTTPYERLVSARAALVLAADRPATFVVNGTRCLAQAYTAEQTSSYAESVHSTRSAPLPRWPCPKCEKALNSKAARRYRSCFFWRLSSADSFADITCKLTIKRS